MSTTVETLILEVVENVGLMVEDYLDSDRLGLEEHAKIAIQRLETILETV